jgi:hypothetical protein
MINSILVFATFETKSPPFETVALITAKSIGNAPKPPPLT